MIRKWNSENLRTPGIGSTPSVVSSITDTLLASQQIPAGTFVVGDNIRIRAMYSKGIANSTDYTIRLHWNTAPNLVGAIQLAQYNVIGSSDTSPSLYRNMTFKIFNTAIMILTGTSLTDDITIGSHSADTISNIFIGSGAYILASAQRTSIQRTFDSITCYYLSIEV